MYAELVCISNFTFLQGASHPEELVRHAAELGYAALALTDECSVSGVVRAHEAAVEVGLKLIVGSHFVLEDGSRIILLARNRDGYAELCRLITHARRNAEKGHYQVAHTDFETHLDDCLGLLLPSSDEAITWFTQRFAGRGWLGLALLREGDDMQRLAQYRAWSQANGLPLVAVGDVCMHARGRRALRDALSAIRLSRPVAELGAEALANGERHLRPLTDLQALYPRDMLQEALRIAGLCTFSLDELRYQYPDDVTPPRQTSRTFLRELVEQGMQRRWPDGCPARVRAQIEHELALIAELEYEPYFLTVWDIVRFARSQKILCQGRGSAANSAVCYCLEITEVDPARMNLLFERFISRERGEPPDIDVDFEHQRREEVIQYIYQKYGRERAALAACVITYRSRSAVRDLGKALGLEEGQISTLVESVSAWRRSGELKQDHLAEAGFDPANPRLRRLLVLVNQLLGFPRHLSQHVGGFVIARERLDELVPIENAAMPERTVIQWEKDDLESLGLLKIDILALGMLSAIRRALDLINRFSPSLPPPHVGEVSSPAYPEQVSAPSPLVGRAGERQFPPPGLPRTWGRGMIAEPPPQVGEGNGRGCSAHRETSSPQVGEVSSPGYPEQVSAPSPLVGRAGEGSLDLSSIPPEDPATYAMIQRADTIGVFQIESRAQMAMLPRLRPASFYDLVIEVAIVRPGPIQGDMVHPYLRRRQGREPVEYPSEAVREVLERTLGVPIFQEQVIKLAMVAAGFSAGEADGLRRAMAAWRRRGGLEPYRDKLMQGMAARGYAQDFAERIYRQILGFGEYGFPESHAASFALLVYVSAWLKAHHPAAFCAAIINSQPMGFYQPAQLVRDAREHAVSVRPVDVRFSAWDCSLEAGPEGRPALRLGLRLVAGLSHKGAQRLLQARSESPFEQVQQVAQRAALDRRDLSALAAADALQGLAGHRYRAAWEAAGVEQALPLFPEPLIQEAATVLPVPSLGHEVLADYTHLGLSLRAHPLALLRDHLRVRGLLSTEEVKACRPGEVVRTAGLVLIRQRPGGGRAVFVTIEDETGTQNLLVWADLAERQRQVLLGAGLLGVVAEIQRAEGVQHLVCRALENHSDLLGRLALRSRDFH